MFAECHRVGRGSGLDCDKGERKSSKGEVEVRGGSRSEIIGGRSKALFRPSVRRARVVAIR